MAFRQPWRNSDAFSKVGSKRTVLRYLAWLEEEGDIQRWPGARGLKPLRALQERIETRLFLAGEVPAGPLMLAEENREGWVQLPKDLLTPQLLNTSY